MPSTEPPAIEPPASEPTDPVDPEMTIPPTADLGRVVVLAEEWLLADVLALGIPVVASSATVPSAGLQGMDGFDTSGIELFDYLNVSLEELAELRADTIIVGEFVVDYLGDEQVAGIDGDLIVVPDGSTGPERLRLLGEAFGRTAQAEALLAELDAAYADASEAVPDDCDVSVVAIYAGPNVAVFAEPVWDAPRAVERLGCRLTSAYMDYTDFRWWRLAIGSARFVGGFGSMSWVTGDEIAAAVVDEVHRSSRGAIDHMNADHAHANLDMVRHLGGVHDATDARLHAIDRHGVTLYADRPSTTGTGVVQTVRLRFPSGPLASPEELRAAVVDLARRAREAGGS